MLTNTHYEHLRYELCGGVEAQAYELQALAERTDDPAAADTLTDAADMLRRAAQMINDAAELARYA